jgi:hypothetical protein
LESSASYGVKEWWRKTAARRLFGENSGVSFPILKLQIRQVALRLQPALSSSQHLSIEFGSA